MCVRHGGYLIKVSVCVSHGFFYAQGINVCKSWGSTIKVSVCVSYGLFYVHGYRCV